MSYVEAARAMSEHTRSRCGTSKCGPFPPRATRCCEPMYCDLAKSIMIRQGVECEEQTHPTLRYMGPEGCVVPPEYRPNCTMHDCRIFNIGEDLDEPEWTAEYFRLRDLMNDGWKDFFG